MDALCLDRKLVFGCLLALALGAWGCSNVYYIPSAVHMPLLEDKNDFDVNLSTRFTDGGQIDIQTAYAPINHFELVLNGMNSSTKYDDSYKKELRFLEAGAGIFHALGDRNKLNKPFRVEFIGGYGLGVGKNIDGSYQAVGRYQRKFVQPSIGIKVKGFEAGFGLRLSEINFSNYSIYDSGILTEKDILDFTTLERCFRFAVVFKSVNFGTQISRLDVLRDQEAYEKATGYNFNQVYVDFFLGFSPSKYKTPEGAPYHLHAIDSSGIGAMEFIMSDNPCWICLPKNAPYKDSIEFKLNGNTLDYSHKSSKTICHRLQLSRNHTNLLSIALKNPAQTLSTPVNITLIDGNIKRPFYIDLSGDKRMDFYLTY